MLNDVERIIAIHLDLSRNRLTEFPLQVCEYESLETLYINNNCLKSIPCGVQFLKSLTFLDLRRNQLSSIPAALCSLPLEVLLLGNNRLESLPNEIRQLADTLADLVTCLPVFPVTLYRLVATDQRDISCNRLTNLPADIGLLQRLRVLNVRQNLLTWLPFELSKLSLRFLDASYNKLTHLDIDLRFMRSLVELILDGNPLVFPLAKENSFEERLDCRSLPFHYRTPPVGEEKIGALSKTTALTMDVTPAGTPYINDEQRRAEGTDFSHQYFTDGMVPYASTHTPPKVTGSLVEEVMSACIERLHVAQEPPKTDVPVASSKLLHTGGSSGHVSPEPAAASRTASNIADGDQSLTTKRRNFQRDLPSNRMGVLSFEKNFSLSDSDQLLRNASMPAVSSDLCFSPLLDRKSANAHDVVPAQTKEESSLKCRTGDSTVVSTPLPQPPLHMHMKKAAMERNEFPRRRLFTPGAPGTDDQELSPPSYKGTVAKSAKSDVIVSLYTGSGLGAPCCRKERSCIQNAAKEVASFNEPSVLPDTSSGQNGNTAKVDNANNIGDNAADRSPRYGDSGSGRGIRVEPVSISYDGIRRLLSADTTTTSSSPASSDTDLNSNMLISTADKFTAGTSVTYPVYVQTSLDHHADVFLHSSAGNECSPETVSTFRAKTDYRHGPKSKTADIRVEKHNAKCVVNGAVKHSTGSSTALPQRRTKSAATVSDTRHQSGESPPLTSNLQKMPLVGRSRLSSPLSNVMDRVTFLFIIFGYEFRGCNIVEESLLIKIRLNKSECWLCLCLALSTDNAFEPGSLSSHSDSSSANTSVKSNDSTIRQQNLANMIRKVKLPAAKARRNVENFLMGCRRLGVPEVMTLP
ncbi:unnamed protein product [Soboliphyme baturini]|uniref:Calponin-homology (CH) domain-containing protein n=1 Tax=Soboliphyme baturini TaxID=241478 RepID=A0A183IAS9_9BILA|nr:unnamed protein product [Soboliphyme baturini]